MKRIYIKIVLVVTAIFIGTTYSFAQQVDSFWTKTTVQIASKQQQLNKSTVPKQANYYKLNENGLKQALQKAPKRKAFKGESQVIIQFPTASSSLESYRVKETSVMAQALQNKYPEIRTYTGVSINNPRDVIRITTSTQGIRATSTFTDAGLQFIEPYTLSDDYVVYAKRDLSSPKPLVCGVIDDLNDERNIGFKTLGTKGFNDGLLRTYKLAITTTAEFSKIQWKKAGLNFWDSKSSKKSAVLADVVSTVNRMNQIFEKEASVSFQLVKNNDDLIFIGKDSYSAARGTKDFYSQTQSVMDKVVGNENYDIGHTFVGASEGGSAARSGLCISPLKAWAYSSDNFITVMHEFGHQLGANHTFNADISNRSAPFAYETILGSTIMSYGDPRYFYYHQSSLDRFKTIIGFSDCAVTTPTGNSTPTAKAGNNYVIPKLTPYKLTGSSTDVDGTETHTYTWEQYDLGPATYKIDETTLGPTLRSFEGTSNPVRYVPKLKSVIANGGVSTEREKLSSVDRDLNFKLTVRDNDRRGGQTAVDGMTATVKSVAGPFVVMSQNEEDVFWFAGDTETVTWDIAGTDANGINTEKVNVLLSLDGGLTYPITLASNVANNGQADVDVPGGVSSMTCRVMVEAVDNIFYNINSTDFNLNVKATQKCITYNPSIPVESTVFAEGFSKWVSINITEKTLITDIRVSADVSHDNLIYLLILLESPNNTYNTVLFDRSCGLGTKGLDIMFKDNEPRISCASPTVGTYAPKNAMENLNGINPSGQWDIVFYSYKGDGVINGCSIDLCTVTKTPLLNTNNFNLENKVSIYPNPNNGEFNINFKPTSNKVGVSVFDISGRSVYNKTYNASGAFSEAINLGDVQSGLYLLKIKDGNNTVTKKIIVD